LAGDTREAADHCLWWDSVTPCVPPPADLPGRCDVLVVGGGYTGLSAARTLARGGARVVLVERGRLGEGASSRNGGFVLPGYKLEVEGLIRRVGLERARVLFADTLAAVDFVEQVVRDEAIACDFSRSGHLVLAARPAHLRGLAATARLLEREFGYRSELIGPGELAREIVTPRYHGGWLDPAAGRIQPAAWLHGLARSALAAGARLLEHSPAGAIRRDAGGFEVDCGARGRIRAGEVLLATNGYSGTLHPPVARRLIPVGSYVIATEPLPPEVVARLGPGRRVWSDTKNHLYYFRFAPDGRMVFGGRAAFTPQPVARAASILQRGLAEVFPDLAGSRIDYAWGGTLGFTLDFLPHATRLDGIAVAMGFGGHGVALAPWLGHRVAQALLGAAPWPGINDVPFPPVPLYRGGPWFLPLAGAYYRVRDWF
jgi:glycine/D-amino acid oxidase-like deaminating enzyme